MGLHRLAFLGLAVAGMALLGQSGGEGAKSTGIVMTSGSLRFAPATCTMGRGDLNWKGNSLTVRVLGQRDEKCYFDYTRYEGTAFTTYRCWASVKDAEVSVRLSRNAAKEVVVTTSFDLAKCVKTRTGDSAAGTTNYVATEAVATPYKVHGKCEPKKREAAASYYVVQDRKDFTAVCNGGDDVLNIAGPAQVVAVVVPPAKANTTLKVVDVVDDQGVLTVKYTTAAAKDAAGATPVLVVSTPAVKYKAVNFVENDKAVHKVDLEK